MERDFDEYILIVYGRRASEERIDGVISIMNGKNIHGDSDDYKRVYVLNGTDRDARPRDYRIVKLAGPYSEDVESVFVVNFDVVLKEQGLVSVLYPGAVVCPYCNNVIYRDSNPMLDTRHPYPFVNCDRCSHTFVAK